MQALKLAFSPRFIVLTLAALAMLLLLLLIGAGAAPSATAGLWAGAVLFGALTALGAHDLMQPRHAILRNYPISAHLRFILEEIRPEMRQYFFESETDGLPFSRTQRAVVYQRAKMALDKRPFGTLRDTEGRRLRMAAAFDHAEAGRRERLWRHRRRARLREALFPCRCSTFRP